MGGVGGLATPKDVERLGWGFGPIQNVAHDKACILGGWSNQHVGAILHEGTLAKDWGFSLTLMARERFGNLLVGRAWDSEVKVWSEYGSKIRSKLGLEFRSEFELALEGGAVDFPMAEADSESEINSSKSELISFSPEVKRAIAEGSP